jgi:hypothetical protein
VVISSVSAGIQKVRDTADLAKATVVLASFQTQKRVRCW